MKITFLGGVEEVTGSRYLIQYEGTNILVDCGMFQGRGSSEKNRKKAFGIEPRDVDAIVITHAHIDHTGYIPAFVKNGFKGKIYTSKATFALSAILLTDSGSIQEEDARRYNKKKKPLYTEKEAAHSLSFFKTVDYDTPIEIGSLTAKLIRSGHILGSSFVVISDGKKKLTFSGDLGRPDQPVMKNPPHIEQTDYLVLESTYGKRLHEEGDPIELLGQEVRKVIEKQGKLIIPAFAVGRTQMLLYFLSVLKQQKAISDIPVFLDSPMAIDVTSLYCDFNDEHKLSPNACTTAFGIATYTRLVKESKKIDKIKGPAIIIAGSGMVTGGRVLEHLKSFISDDKNTVLFVGYQAKGTLGRELIEGAQNIELDGKSFVVNAEIQKLNSLSAHADYQEILAWLKQFTRKPKKVFLTHGEIDAAQALKQKIEKQFGWDVAIPKYLDSFELD